MNRIPSNSIGMSSGMQSTNKLGGTLTRFIPEPKNRLGFDFGSVLKSVASGIGSVSSTAGINVPGLDSSYQTLINQQIEVQQQMQLVSLESNIEKSKHETQMAAIRNLRSA